MFQRWRGPKVSNLDELREQIESIMEPPEFMTTKAEIVAYYQQEYGKRWRIELERGPLSEISGLKPKNLARRFDPSRLNNVPRTRREKEQYEKLGKLLPPKKEKRPPKNGFRVRVKGRLNPSPKRKGEKAREREFSAEFEGMNAYDFGLDPSLEAFFEEYGIDGNLADLLDDGAKIAVEPL
jgi:coenzyme F420-reducing hydrogenase alpha subunit